MGHETANDLVREMASLYVLGALSPAEAQDFERHLAEGCAVCRAEVDEFQETAGVLPLGFDLAPPPPRVREMLLERIQDPTFAPAVHVARAGESGFQAAASPGVSIKQLFQNIPRGESTMLVRMQPGASYPPHHHADIEHCYVLEGDLHFADGVVMRAGDYAAARKDSDHAVSFTENGCLLLIIASEQNATL